MLSCTARSAFCVLTAIVVASCGDSEFPTSDAALLAEQSLGGSRGENGTSAVRNARSLVNTVHAATARFHSMEQARKAGYVEDPHCVAHPTLGGMGFHWVNNPLVDPVFDPLRPEALVYSPDKNGKPKLAAVEYIVIDVGQPAPSFAGQPFDVGGTPVPVPHWSLHVWLHRENPSGIFSPWNPAVRCGA